jgi:alpha-tubulin suppressor-like RCC1 family protein
MSFSIRGMHHSLALSAEGHVYSFGRGDSGQLGIGEKEAEPCPTRVQIGDPVASINCGSNHSMAVTRGVKVPLHGLVSNLLRLSMLFCHQFTPSCF